MYYDIQAFNLLSNLLKPLTFKGHYSCTQPFWSNPPYSMEYQKGPHFYLTLVLENIPLAWGTFHMVRAPFVFHIIPQYGSLGSYGLSWDLVQTPRGLCNNNSFINKHDVMTRSSDCFLMSFFNLLTKELWQILEIFFWGCKLP